MIYADAAVRINDVRDDRLDVRRLAPPHDSAVFGDWVKEIFELLGDLSARVGRTFDVTLKISEEAVGFIPGVTRQWTPSQVISEIEKSYRVLPLSPE